MESGIYYMECLRNNKKYVGSAENLHVRELEHFKLLSHNRSNKLMQQDYNLYGANSFHFVTIEILPNDDALLIEKENFYMNLYKTYVPVFGHDYGYNLNKASRSRHSDNSKVKLSLSLRQKNALLTLEQCLSIKNMLLKSELVLQKDRQQEVAENFHVSEFTVGRILRGEYWCSKELGGGYKDWVNFDKEALYLNIKIELDKGSNESMSEKDSRIAAMFDISPRTVQRIRLGKI